jgi:hypothetical protein
MATGNMDIPGNAVQVGRWATAAVGMRQFGVVTRPGRTFHRTIECPGYRRGIFGDVVAHTVEKVSAKTAKARGKGVCARCWTFL